nr:DUF2066 domain-containing protein [Alteromonas sp. 5E99-2]
MCFAIAIPVHSASFVNVNQGDVIVAKNKREQQEALKQVIVKMTGTKDSLSTNGIKKALRSARDYILSYEYYLDGDHQRYKAIFDRKKIELLIRQEQLPIWGPRRPDAIVWLASKKQNDVLVVSENDNSPLRDKISAASASRGVDMLFPIMDLDDRLNVTETDVWARFMPIISNASSRYGTDYTIAARLIDTNLLKAQLGVESQSEKAGAEYSPPHRRLRGFARDELTLEQALNEEEIKRENNSLQPSDSKQTQRVLGPMVAIPDDASIALEWTIENQNEILSGRFFGTNEDELVHQLVDEYANLLGQKFAITPNEASTVKPLLTVSNVSSLSDVFELNSYLNDLTVVQGASLQKVDGHIATFSVSLIGSLVDLNNTIALDQRLTEIEGGEEALTPSDILQLNYFWQG